MAGPKKKILTTERRAELDNALEAANGNLVDTSRILGCTAQTLKKWIMSDDVMTRKWMPSWLADNDADTSIHKPQQLSGPQRRELALAKEEESLRQGFRELGVDDETTAYLVTVAGFTNGRIEGVTDLLTGGMVAASLNLIEQSKSLKEDVDRMHEDPDRFSDLNEKGVVIHSGWRKVKDARQQMIENAKELRNLAKDIRDMRIADAKIHEIKRRQMEDAQKPKKSAGFGGPPEVFGSSPNLTQEIHHHHGMKEADKV